MLGGNRRHHAEKLIAAQTHEQVIGAHLISQILGDVLEKRVAGAMAMLVVDCLKTVHVNVRGRQALTRSARPVNFPPEILEPHAAAPRAGQLVSSGVLAVAPGLLAVALSKLAVNPAEPSVSLGALAIHQGPHTTLNPTHAQLPYGQGRAIRQPVNTVKLKRDLVLEVSLPVPPGREFVARLRRIIASPCSLVANLTGPAPFSSAVSTASGRFAV